jgi:hypothetical protein
MMLTAANKERKQIQALQTSRYEKDGTWSEYGCFESCQFRPRSVVFMMLTAANKERKQI